MPLLEYRRHYFCRQRLRHFQQRDVGSGAVREQSLQIELRVAHDTCHVKQTRFMRRVKLDDLVCRIGFNAVTSSQHQVTRDRPTGAERSVRADDHHRMARPRGARRIACDGAGGRRR